MKTLAAVRGLSIAAESTGSAPGQTSAILQNVDLDVSPGDSIGIVGESGSGKSTLALALLGHLRPGLKLTAGSVHLEGISLFEQPPETLARLRGRRVALVPQNISQALTPTMRIREMLSEVIRHTGSNSNVDELLRSVGLPENVLGRRYPHQLSGGQRQRVALALALAGKPSLLVLDEPTTGLDMTTQARILDLFEQIRRETGVALVMISHDLGVVGKISEHLVVMYAGQVVESGPTQKVLKDPQHPYTGKLVAADPRTRPMRVRRNLTTGSPTPLFATDSLSAGYGPGGLTGLLRRAFHRAVPPALDTVTLGLSRGETLAIVGESGSGKSTLARVVVGLHSPSAGRIQFAGNDLSRPAAARPASLRRQIQIVFQNPDASLNPRHTVETILYRPLRLFFGMSRAQAAGRIHELLEQVRLDRSLAHATPRQLSGGERQRVAIARALAAEPELIVCDEVLSALDVSVQSSVLDLLLTLQKERDLSYLFITHDLALVKSFADSVAVLCRGRLCEVGPVDEVFQNPKDPYTAELLGLGLGAGTNWGIIPQQGHDHRDLTI